MLYPELNLKYIEKILLEYYFQTLKIYFTKSKKDGRYTSNPTLKLVEMVLTEERKKERMTEGNTDNCFY